MFINREEVGKFLQFTIYNIVLPTAQAHEKKDNFIWCRDYEEIEYLKCIYEGTEKYLAYEPPYRAKDNPFFSKERIVNFYKGAIQNYETALDKSKDIATLLIRNSGRGIDILMLSMERSWNKILLDNVDKTFDNYALRYFSKYNIVQLSEQEQLKEKVLLIDNGNDLIYRRELRWSILDQEN